MSPPLPCTLYLLFFSVVFPHTPPFERERKKMLYNAFCLKNTTSIHQLRIHPLSTLLSMQTRSSRRVHHATQSTIVLGKLMHTCCGPVKAYWMHVLAHRKRTVPMCPKHPLIVHEPVSFLLQTRSSRWVHHGTQSTIVLG